MILKVLVQSFGCYATLRLKNSNNTRHLLHALSIIAVEAIVQSKNVVFFDYLRKKKKKFTYFLLSAKNFPVNFKYFLKKLSSFTVGVSFITKLANPTKAKYA